jgi:fido (protein-threonine AMPylation protein)
MEKDEEMIGERYLDFDEYIRHGEPSRREVAYAWSTAIGLQAVDGLKTSEYLQETARRNIEGEITIDEARQLIKSYYQNKTVRTQDDEDMEEADRVSANIVKILSQPTFAFNTNGYISVHRRIFEGIFKHAGQLRTYDITKKEWILRGDTVNYLNWEDLRLAIDYDLEQERHFSYTNLSPNEMVKHIAYFVSALWQIHPFREGNTRTTAVFTIQYLRTLGFNVTNDMFAKHSWYFRNALVRANYKNVVNGIDYTPVYLERFFSNLLLGDQWDLRSRYLHISPTEEWREQPNFALQVQDKHRTSTGQVRGKLNTVPTEIAMLLKAIGTQQLSVREIMDVFGLKGRDNFMNLYLKPAIAEGYVSLLFPDKPKHPRQKYLLTAKGILLLKSL